MPRVRQSAAERTAATYRSLCEVETQTFSEMLRAAEKMGIGILIFDKENYEPLLKPKG